MSKTILADRFKELFPEGTIDQRKAFMAGATAALAYAHNKTDDLEERLIKLNILVTELSAFRMTLNPGKYN